MPGSVAVPLQAPPQVVIAAADSEVAAAGLAVAHLDPDEGYLETRWYDLAARRTVDDRARDLAHMIKLRFFADPTAGRTHLAAECVERIAYDPSEPPRYWERMVGDSTPGRALLDSIVAHLKVKFPLPPPQQGEAPRP